MQIALKALLRFAAITGPKAALQRLKSPSLCLTLPPLQTIQFFRQFVIVRKERSAKVESNQLAN
jgi:hypothetical protein